MDKSRRDFFKKLSAIAVAAAFPLPSEGANPCVEIAENILCLPKSMFIPGKILHCTVTGRISCSEPNYQNIPKTATKEFKMVRDAFVGDYPAGAK